jgi:iron complex outermembrane recepter protein
MRDSVNALVTALAVMMTPLLGYGECLAETTEELEEIEVVATTPTHGVGLSIEKVPAHVQASTSKDLERTQALDLSAYLNRSLGSVTINAAQNNPLQPDVQFRGFTASPLLGLPQGLAVYQNSVRLNEVFGDTVNWDIIPKSAIASINLMPGSNPLFGQNTLGGALSIQTKNGFTHPGHRLEIMGGSFGRTQTSVETGAKLGDFAYFATVSYFHEDGWRIASESAALNFFGSVGWHTENSVLDLNFSHGDTELRGNGPLPVQMVAFDRSAVFTFPDITRNDMQLVDLEGSHWLNDKLQVSGNFFYRWNETYSFNGDGTPFEPCAGAQSLLCEAGRGVGVDEGRLRDQFGRPVSSRFEAVNNISLRPQSSYGGSLQATWLRELFEHENQLIVGSSYNQGLVSFDSTVELARLLDDRGTAGSGLHVPQDATSLSARTRTWSIYISDTLSFTERLGLTLSGRYNSTAVHTGDSGGLDPDLNGAHEFERFNPAAGLTYKLSRELNFYGSYSESSRAPTPVELTCARPDAPCRLPNAFLADPPLQQVVAKGFEAGMRGELRELGGLTLGDVDWNLNYFETINQNDILFQSVGGTTGNRGFFANVGETRRRGLELGFTGRQDRLHWFFNYSLVQATFEQAFLASSANHPAAAEDGTIAVSKGHYIPGIPEHSLKLGLDYELFAGLTLGGDLIYNAGQYLRGD